MRKWKLYIKSFCNICFIIVVLLILSPCVKGQTTNRVIGKGGASLGDEITLGKAILLKGDPDLQASIKDPELVLNASFVHVVRDDNLKYYFVLTKVRTWPKKSILSSKYPVEGTTLDVFDPQFSPDGKHVLFKVGGMGESFSMYRMYLWNLDTNKVSEIIIRLEQDTNPLMFTFPVTKWSPDGKFISYIRGGTAHGELKTLDRLFLDTYDLINQKRFFVVRNDAVRFGYEWAYGNKLYYSALNEKSVDIYFVNAEGNEKKLVLKNAYRPYPSPDGSKLAYFANENQDTAINRNGAWDVITRGLALVVANNDGTQRKVLSRVGVTYPHVLWLPGNRELITIDREKYIYDSDSKVESSTQVKKWDVQTGKWSLLCSLNTTDIEPVFRPYNFPQFNPLGITPNGRKLLIAESEMIGFSKTGYKAKLTIKSIDILSGKTANLSTLEGATTVSVFFHK